jgi:hypothetical protein
MEEIETHDIGNQWAGYENPTPPHFNLVTSLGWTADGDDFEAVPLETFCAVKQFLGIKTQGKDCRTIHQPWMPLDRSESICLEANARQAPIEERGEPEP